MTEFLRSIQSDLLSRRMLPLLAVLGVALLAAVGYALAAGSGSGSNVPAGLASTATGSSSTSSRVSVAPENPHVAVSETPGGARYQSQGPTRDPFTPLASPPETKSTTVGATSSSKASSSSGASSGAGGSSKTGSGSGGTPTPAPTPKKPSKPVTTYLVSVSFGPASTTPGQSATLTPYQNLNIGQLLPSKQDARIAFERVTSDGKGAVFTLVVAPILHGQGRCLPSTSECQTIDLEAGQSEQLEYIEANGQTVIYELKVVAIAKKTGSASSARVKRAAKAARVKPEAHAALIGHNAPPAGAKRR